MASAFRLRLQQWLWGDGATTWSLRFEDSGVEAGFLKQTDRQFVSNMSFVLMVGCIAVATGVLTDLSGVIPGPFAGSCDVPRGTALVWAVSFCCFGGFIVALFVMLRVPRLLRKTRPIQRERLAMTFFCTANIYLQCFHPFYLTKLFGGNLHEDCSLRPINSPDLYIQLLVMNVIAAAHLTVPMRWFSLVPLAAQTLIINAFCVFGLGSNEGFARSSANYALLCTLVLMMSKGKRNLERSERKLFKRLLSEQTLRTQAEFELSRMECDRSSRAIGHDLQSVTVPSTTPTEQAFRDVVEHGEERSRCLETLAEIGHREQWLINEQEVCISACDGFLGHGSFGLVVKGSFQGTPVAVKAPLDSVQSELSLADIGNELRILRRLRHPHIILCHGAVIDSCCGEVALVLELLRGQSMRNFMSRMPSCDARCQCLLGICRALAYLHSRKPRVVHGDLKDSNIMVQFLKGSLAHPEVVHAKLLDFGLARVLTRRAVPLGGTVRWKAPELFVTPIVKPDRAADVYSFGCVLFFAVCGKTPLDELDTDMIKTLRQLGLRLHLNWPLDTQLIGQCQTMVDQATALDPQTRPSMQQVCEDLLQWPEVRQAHVHELQAHDHAVPSEALVSFDDTAKYPSQQQLWARLSKARKSIWQKADDAMQLETGVPSVAGHSDEQNLEHCASANCRVCMQL